MTESPGSAATTERRERRPAPRGGGRAARRAGPVRGAGVFYRQVAAELRKVIWPTRREMIAYTTVALVFVSAMVAIIAALDIGFAKAVLEVFG